MPPAVSPVTVCAYANPGTPDFDWCHCSSCVFGIAAGVFTPAESKSRNRIAMWSVPGIDCIFA